VVSLVSRVDCFGFNSGQVQEIFPFSEMISLALVPTTHGKVAGM